LNSLQVTEDGEPVQGNEVRPYLPTPVESQLENVASSHVQDPTPKRGSGSVSPQARVPRRCFQIEDEVFLCTPLKVEEPTSFQEAVDLPNHKEWMDAMKDEMDSMATNKV